MGGFFLKKGGGGWTEGKRRGGEVGKGLRSAEVDRGGERIKER